MSEQNPSREENQHEESPQMINPELDQLVHIEFEPPEERMPIFLENGFDEWLELCREYTYTENPTWTDTGEGLEGEAYKQIRRTRSDMLHQLPKDMSATWMDIKEYLEEDKIKALQSQYGDFPF